LESELYLRLKLRSFRGTLESTSETSTQEDDVVGFDVSLLLHRFGVALLSMRAELPSGRQADQLIPMLAGDWLRLKQTILPEPVVKFASRGWGVSNQAWEGTWSDDVEEGIRWLHSVGSSFTDVFRAYQEAIVWSARIRDPGSDWLCYPTLLIDSPACCGSESRWRRRHLRELVGIAARYAPYRSIPVAELDRLLGARHVLMGGDLLLINEGMATQLHWAFDGSRQLTIADELSRLALSEHVLLQYWQLRLLDRTLDATEQRQRELLNAQRQVIYGLEEYRHSRLSYGTAREIADSFKARFGIEQLYERLIERLNAVQQLITADQAARLARQNNRLAGAAFTATAVLALPAIREALSIAQMVSPTGVFGRLVAPLQAIAKQGSTGAWTLYCSLVATVAIVLLAGRVKFRRGHRRYSLRELGYIWDRGSPTIILQGAGRRDAPVDATEPPN
jgi:hypothetical protein